MATESKTDKALAQTGAAAPKDIATRMGEQAKQNLALSGSDKLRLLSDKLRKLGLNDADMEVVAAGKIPFWPAYAGALLMGTVQSYGTRTTRFETEDNPTGAVGVFIVRVEGESVLGGNSDGEVFEVKPGEMITVLERTVMKSLGAEKAQGKKIGILCLGKERGEKFDYWDYQVMASRPAQQA